MVQLRIDFDDDLWEKFKEGIPRKQSIKEYLTELIKRDIEKKEVLNGN
jgi:hypothetical protein